MLLSSTVGEYMKPLFLLLLGPSGLSPSPFCIQTSRGYFHVLDVPHPKPLEPPFQSGFRQLPSPLTHFRLSWPLKVWGKPLLAQSLHRCKPRDPARSSPE